MKFSVVVPVYNVERYIGECIESVLSQTYPDYELLLINDGSTDRSESICADYCQRHEKASLISNSNQGVYLSRLCGVSNAVGGFIVFLDADDCLRSDALERLNEAIEKYSCDLVVFNASTTADYKTTFRNYGISEGQLFEGDSKTAVYQMLVHSSVLNNVGLKAAKRSLFEEGRCSLAEPVKYGEDFLTSLHLLTAAKRIAFLNQNLYFYRQRKGSAVHTFDLNRMESLKIIHRCAEEYIDSWGLPELKPGHYARETRGWTDLCVQIIENGVHSGDRRHRGLLKSMSVDPYFLNAYEKMDSSCLTCRQRVLASWLKKKKWLHLRTYVSVKKIKNHIMAIGRTLD